MRRLLVAALVVVLGWPGVAMATDWNPNSATTVGLETFLTEQGDQLIAGGAAAAQTFDSTASETVDTMSLFLTGASEEPSTVLLEVFPKGSETNATDDVSTATFLPSDDLQIGGVDSEGSTWIEGSTSGGLGSIGTSNLFQAIDDASLNVDDWISYNGARSSRKRYRMNFDTSGSNWPASRRVVGGRVNIVANREGINGRLQVSFFDGSNSYPLGTVTATPQRRTLSVRFPEYNPATGLPWTRAQIQALASTSAIQLRTVGVGKQKRLRVYRVSLGLDYVTETRLAVGRVEIDPTVAPESGAWVPFTLSVPNSGVDNWSKGTSNYTIVLRRISGLGSVSWRWLAESAGAAAALGRAGPGEMLPFSAYVPTMEGRGFISSLGEVVAGRAQAFYVTTTAPATSADGQPYSMIVAGSIQFGSDGSGQTFVAGATASHTSLRLVLTAMIADGNEFRAPTDAEMEALADDLTATIHNQSTGATVGTGATITPEDFTAAPVVGSGSLLGSGIDIGNPLSYRLVEVDVAASLTSGTTYNVILTQPSPSAGIQWLTGVPLGGVAAPTFGGSTAAYGAASGGIVSTGTALADLLATLSIQPATPTSFTATTDPEASGNEGTCGPAFIDRIQLTHDASGLGGSFARYEYQRQNPDGDWETIRTEDTSATTSHDDWEARLGEVETYRMRQVRSTDLVPSAWTATDTATATRYGYETKIASNHADDGAGAAVAYERGPDYQWTWDEQVERLPRQGEDGRWSFHGPDDPGFDTNLDLLIFDGVDPSTPGVRMFAPLRDLLRADVPHFAFCDGDGDRVYGDGRVTDTTRAELGNESIYEATVEVAQTQFTPTPVST